MDEKVNRVTTTCLLLMILLWGRGDCSPEKCSHRISSLQGVDAIQITRCDIVCFYRKDKKECHRECMRAPFKKRGHCPDSFDDLPVFVYACVYFCSKDSDCVSTEKCCTHSCGQTCKPASGLLQEKYLPPVPVNLTAKEKRRNGVQITWEMLPLESNQLVLYVLEERHHLGRFFNERLLGEWNPIYNCRKTSVTLKNTFKSGYWYQFRVASVNINGTRGFSLGSEGFMFIRRPKLPKPSKLRVEEVCEKNGTIWGMLRWEPSEAVIPIQKYKIFCGHRLDVEEKSESVFVERASVPQVSFLHFGEEAESNDSRPMQPCPCLEKSGAVFPLSRARNEGLSDIFRSNSVQPFKVISSFQNPPRAETEDFWKAMNDLTRIRVIQYYLQQDSMYSLVDISQLGNQCSSIFEYQLFYQLKNLKKNTDYFIQVQAVALFGRNSLKSKMAKILFRTSKMEDQFELADFD